jgi:hypothetical protein
MSRNTTKPKERAESLFHKFLFPTGATLSWVGGEFDETLYLFGFLFVLLTCFLPPLPFTSCVEIWGIPGSAGGICFSTVEIWGNPGSGGVMCFSPSFRASPTVEIWGNPGSGGVICFSPSLLHFVLFPPSRYGVTLDLVEWYCPPCIRLAILYSTILLDGLCSF